MTLSDKQNAALKALVDRPLDAKEIAKAVGIRSARSMLQSLNDQGYIRYNGNGARKYSEGMWELTSRGMHAVKTT